MAKPRGKTNKAKKTAPVAVAPVVDAAPEETIVEETVVEAAAEEEPITEVASEEVQQEEVQQEEEVVPESGEAEEVEATEEQQIKPKKQKKIFDMVSYHRAYRNSEKWKEYIANYNQTNKEHINELKKQAAKQKQELKLFVKELIANNQVKFENQDMLTRVCGLIKMKISDESVQQLLF